MNKALIPNENKNDIQNKYKLSNQNRITVTVASLNHTMQLSAIPNTTNNICFRLQRVCRICYMRGDGGRQAEGWGDAPRPRTEKHRRVESYHTTGNLCFFERTEWRKY